MKPLFLCVLGVCGMIAASAQPVFEGPHLISNISVAGLNEPSGLAVSRDNSGVFWTHNDKGNQVQLFAIHTNGTWLATYSIGKFAYDPEDIAIGPGPMPGISYLYLADIGDNNFVRPWVALFRAPEPAVYAGQPARNAKLVGAKRFLLFYPDGRHDAESLMVDPVSGDIFIATKESSGAGIYRVTQEQLGARGHIVMQFVTAVNFPYASAGDISVDGRTIMLRNDRGQTRIWPRAADQTVANALQSGGYALPPMGFGNVEGAGFDRFGHGFFTITDQFAPQPLEYYVRTDADAGPVPVVLVDTDAVWRLNDNGIDPGATWLSNDFDDSLWKIGAGPFGFGSGSFVQTLATRTKGAITTCFRKTFVNTTPMQNLTLKLIYDDAAVVYVNGVRALAVNLPADASFSTQATLKQQAHQECWFTYALNASLLLPGTNIIAVEIHQKGASSPDMRFNAQLIGTPAPQ